MATLEPAIRSEWEHFFDTVNSEEDWITPLLTAVDSVAVETAFWRPSREVASIAEIVAHVTGHLEATLRAVLGMPDQDYEDWPEVADSTIETWRALLNRLQSTVADLRRTLHNLSLEDLYGSPRGKESRRSTLLTDILVHNAYHAGQIVKLRQAFAAERVGATA